MVGDVREKARAPAVRLTQTTQMEKVVIQRGAETLRSQRWVRGAQNLDSWSGQRPWRTSDLERRQAPWVVGSGSWRKEEMASPRVARGRKDEGRLKRMAAVAMRAIELRRATDPRREAFKLTSQVGSAAGRARQYWMEDWLGTRSRMAPLEV
jgi:hypothetical protein